MMIDFTPDEIETIRCSLFAYKDNALGIDRIQTLCNDLLRKLPIRVPLAIYIQQSKGAKDDEVRIAAAAEGLRIAGFEVDLR